MASRKDILLGILRGGGQLTTGQQIKLCLSMSYPAILAQLSSVMMQYIDTAMVGHLGPAAGASIDMPLALRRLWDGRNQRFLRSGCACRGGQQF